MAMLNPYGYPGAPSIWDLIMMQRNQMGGNYGPPTQTIPGQQVPGGMGSGQIPGQGFTMKPGSPNLPAPFQPPGVPQAPLSVQQVNNPPAPQQDIYRLGGPPQRPLLPPPQSGPQIDLPYMPQNTGAPSAPPPAQAPGTAVNVPGLLSNIMSYMKVPLAGPVGAYAAMTGPADTGEDPNLAARVKGAGYDPLSSVRAPGRPVREDRSAKEPPLSQKTPSQPKRPVTPTPDSARAPSVPLPPERPAGLLSQDPSFLQRLVSGQWTAPQIDQGMVLPNDWMNRR